MPRKAKRQWQVPRSWSHRVVSHNLGPGGQTAVLCKSRKYFKPPSHLFRPAKIIFKKAVNIKYHQSEKNVYNKLPIVVFKIICVLYTYAYIFN